MQALHPEDLERFRSRSVAEEDPHIMHEWRMRFGARMGSIGGMLVEVSVRGKMRDRPASGASRYRRMVHAQNALREK